MAKIRSHPRMTKRCVFCEYWIGDAGLTFINSLTGYEYDNSVWGKCAKKNVKTPASGAPCMHYEPSREAKKVL